MLFWLKLFGSDVVQVRKEAVEHSFELVFVVTLLSFSMSAFLEIVETLISVIEACENVLAVDEFL